MIKRLLLSTGEPAGIGPDLAILLAQQALDCELVCLADENLLQQRAKQLGRSIHISLYDKNVAPCANKTGQLKLIPIATQAPVVAGKLDVNNAAYVLAMLDYAIEACLDKRFDALVTAPVQKSIINEAGIAFTGHTEYLAAKTHSEQVVMMLASNSLRVALATTHLPLKDVSQAITGELLERVIRIMQNDLEKYWALPKAHILVAGLNPHAGEAGHLGTEEIDTIIPVIHRLKQQGFQLTGPLPADTLFTNKYLDTADAVLAMYHDQGLPVLKYQGFGHAANITLGLPMIRTSVDHGTALDLAGTGKIDLGSLLFAVKTAQEMADNYVQ